MRALLYALAVAGALLLLQRIDHVAARDLGQYGAVDQATHDWFQSLMNQKGEVCCDTSDGHRVEDPNWGIGADGYWVVVNGKQQDVPPELIVRGKNRMGYAIAWLYPPAAPVLRCFMPGSTG